MASISSSFHCISSSPSSAFNSTSSSAFATGVRFKTKKTRPISAVCAAPPVAERSPASASLYSLLGIQSAASCQEIKAAYRRLARVLHPDAATANGGRNGASASDFIRVHEAYATLSDPAKRADYDRELLVRRRLMKGSNSPFANNVSGVSSNGQARGPTVSRFTRRSSNWETDQCW